MTRPANTCVIAGLVAVCQAWVQSISGPPILVKQDVKYFPPQAVRERESSLAVAAVRTNLSELARVNSENEARLERGKTTAKSLPDPHPFPRSCGVRSSRFSSCERSIHQSLRAVGVHLLNSMPTMNYRKPSVPDNGGCKCLQLDCNGCLTAPLRHLMNQSCLRSDCSL